MTQVKKNYDSDFCGSLPLNFTNQVQPYGVLVVLDKDTFEVIQVSQNIEEVTGRSAEQTVSTPFSQYVSANEFTEFSNRFKAGGIKDKLPFTFTFILNGNQVKFLAVIHAKESYLILELEKIDTEDNRDVSFLNIYQEVKYAMAAIENADTIADVCHAGITELKKLSGFDKIMVYRFDEQWNGIVVAEVKEEEMDTYLGLRFPASDIPKQARAMYQNNPYRQIPDKNYTPVKLYPVINPLTQAFTDLSDCNMRSVAAVHIEYLTNMGVISSMSTRIIKDNKLWGLIACHHRTAKFLNYELCTVFELLSGVISSRLTSIQTREDLAYNNNIHDIKSRLTEQIYTNYSLVDGLLEGNTTLLDLLGLQGVAIIYKNEIRTLGRVPDNSLLKNIVLWLQSNNVDKVYHTRSLSEAFDEAKEYKDIASGMIVFPIHIEKGEYIIGFRPEAIQEVKWGGNPNEAINFEKDRKNYHPRHSFELWQQTVKAHSLPWSEQELATAESFRNVILEFALKEAYAG